MNHHRADDAGRPKPQWLAAYVDGELSSDRRALVESWLTTHPETAAEVEVHQRLPRLCRDTAPPEPGEAQWDAVLAHMEARLSVKAAEQRPSRRRLAWLITGLTAASVLLAATLFVPSAADYMAGWFSPSVSLPRNLTDVPEAPLAVASADDIEIISMDDADRDALVVGEPPVREPLTLLAADEVHVEEVIGNMDGMNPRYFPGGGTAPMLIVEPSQTPPPDTKEP
jgi:hypothetical protein